MWDKMQETKIQEVHFKTTRVEWQEILFISIKIVKDCIGNDRVFVSVYE